VLKYIDVLIENEAIFLGRIDDAEYMCMIGASLSE
jgi:hypothetical protein